MKLYIKTLTPVHIGTGKELEKFEYQVRDGSFQRINFDRLCNLLMKKYPEQFHAWINELANEQNTSGLLSLDRIKSKVAGNKKIEEEIAGSTNYIFNCDFSPGNKVRECVKDGNNEVFIPGSSMKGIIRTALLFNAVSRLDSTKSGGLFQKGLNEINKLIREEKEINERMSKLDHTKDKNEIEKGNKKLKDLKYRKNKLKENFDKYIGQEILYCGVRKSENEKEANYSDEKFDLMKLISFSDSNSLESESNGKIVNVKMFKLRSDKSKDLICAEAINKNSILEFDFSINIEFIEKARSELKKNGSNFGKKDWIGFTEKFNFLFNLDLDTIKKEDIGDKIISHILSCVNDFGKEIFAREKKWLETLNGIVGSNEIKSFYSASPENLIKIGYASGFTATTLFLCTLNYKKDMQKVLDYFQIGYHRSSRSNANIEEFPITRRYDNISNEFSALGWIQLSKERPTEIESGEVSKPKFIKQEGWVEAEIVQIMKRPYKIKILEGELKDTELNFQYGNIENLKVGKRLYVTIAMNRKQKLDSKTEFRGFIDKENS